MNLKLRSDVMRAKDSNILYVGRNLVCTGSNTFDTGFAPFSSANANADFMITIRLSGFTHGTNQATLLSCKYEGTLSGQQWPGFLIREKDSQTNVIEIGGYNYATPNVSSLLNTNLYIWRKSGQWHYKIGTGSTGSLNVRVASFNQNIIIGGAEQTNGTKFRLAKCVVDYIRIELI